MIPFLKTSFLGLDGLICINDYDTWRKSFHTNSVHMRVTINESAALDLHCVILDAIGLLSSDMGYNGSFYPGHTKSMNELINICYFRSTLIDT